MCASSHAGVNRLRLSFLVFTLFLAGFLASNIAPSASFNVVSSRSQSIVFLNRLYLFCIQLASGNTGFQTLHLKSIQTLCSHIFVHTIVGFTCNSVRIVLFGSAFQGLYRLSDVSLACNFVCDSVNNTCRLHLKKIMCSLIDQADPQFWPPDNRLGVDYTFWNHRGTPYPSSTILVVVGTYTIAWLNGCRYSLRIAQSSSFLPLGSAINRVPRGLFSRRVVEEALRGFPHIGYKPNFWFN